MKVVIADDHRIVREGLRMLIGDEGDVEVTGEAANGAELLELIDGDRPDVVLLDIRMPQMDGLEVLEALDQMQDPPRVIVLSMHDDAAYVRRAIELGAGGYLLKSVAKPELLRVLEVVDSGSSYIQGELARSLVAGLADGAEAPQATDLTVRQVAILERIAAGGDNHQIAESLNMSESLVKAELRTVYSALGVTRRSEAVAVAMRLRIIS